MLAGADQIHLQVGAVGPDYKPLPDAVDADM